MKEQTAKLPRNSLDEVSVLLRNGWTIEVIDGVKYLRSPPKENRDISWRKPPLTIEELQIELAKAHLPL